MDILKTVLLTVVLVALIIASIYQISFRKRINILFVNCINIVLSVVIIVLEILSYYAEIDYNNLLMVDLLFVLSNSILLSSILIKNFQEIRFSYSNAGLCMIFSILSIIFSWYMIIYRKIGDYTFEGLILLIISVLLYIIASISNVYFTKGVSDIINYNSKSQNKEVLVVRHFTLGKKIVKATYIQNQNYKFINIKCNLTIFFYYVLSIIIVLL